jgi:hypothetical protein
MSDLFLKLFPAAAAAISLVVLLLVVLRFHQFTRASPTKNKKEEDEVSSLVAGMTREIASLTQRLSTLESEYREPAGGVTVRSGMNLNKRTQALRQYRLGQGADSIAKSLDMSKAEVDLLLKVHRIVSQ